MRETERFIGGGQYPLSSVGNATIAAASPIVVVERVNHQAISIAGAAELRYRTMSEVMLRGWPYLTMHGAWAVLNERSQKRQSR